DEEATRHLNAMNLLARERALPWRLTFSYARALQNPALKIWQGDPANIDQARQALLARARLNALASNGEYNEALEQQVAA
ncbi:MAG TPA: class I fructose-bisphosphate aldolase, partial [Thiohalobacter sp.]|nr:class I fructose-bisphosphate aldolase [Thiohalobacter sp.]